MKTVHVNASTEYDVLIGHGLLGKTGESCALYGAKKALIVTDSTVAELYLNTVSESLKASEITPEVFVFPAGEASKNKDILFDILEFAAGKELGRNDLFIALGGGVAGDLTGLASALYMRGTAYIQLPTTLLAAVDSSVGGKTAVDLNGGKNLAGVFHQPALVICDTDTFSTLPENIFAQGMAEVIKYGVIFDRELFDRVKSGTVSDIDGTVERCVRLKAECVEKDEFDRGERRLLNLGHTFAHAIEKRSGFAVSHGEAVAVGMVMAAELSCRLGICGGDCIDEITDALINNGLPVKCGYESAELLEYMKTDKKRSDREISFILPEKIGSCIIRNTEIF